ncbi:Ribulose-phosphate binding barrel [Sesbania bispinosa]|nr:Ribulose-phosphate binding barrel [Sesbania bispinosa]
MYNTTVTTHPEHNPYSFKLGIAQTLRGGATNPHQAKITKQAGASADVDEDTLAVVSPSELLQPPFPPVIQDPQSTQKIQDERINDHNDTSSSTYDIPHQAQLLAALSKKVMDMNELRRFTCGGVPDAAGIRSTVWKLLLGYLPPDQGSLMLGIQVDLMGSGNIADTIKNDEDEVFTFAKKIEELYDLVMQTKQMGRLPVVHFAAGGIVTPADAAGVSWCVRGI